MERTQKEQVLELLAESMITPQFHTQRLAKRFKCVMTAGDVEFIGYGEDKEQAKESAAKRFMDEYRERFKQYNESDEREKILVENVMKSKEALEQSKNKQK